MAAKTPCAICAYPGSRCAGCQQVSYCSREHQKQGWPKHKKLCKIYQQAKPPSLDTYCGLCGATSNLTKTECCDRTICNDEDKYQMFTYSNVSCTRNHRRYTVCGYHHTEGHEGHWQNCEKCRSSFRSREDLAGKGTSSFNFREDKWEDAPTFEPTKCTKCSRIIKLGSEAHSMVQGGYQCAKCVGMHDFASVGMMDGRQSAMS